MLQPVKVLTPEERGAARWAAFLADPDTWLDQRRAKAAGALGPRHPDFVHSADKRRGLWLDSASTPPQVHKARAGCGCGSAWSFRIADSHTGRSRAHC